VRSRWPLIALSAFVLLAGVLLLRERGEPTTSNAPAAHDVQMHSRAAARPLSWSVRKTSEERREDRASECELPASVRIQRAVAIWGHLNLNSGRRARMLKA